MKIRNIDFLKGILVLLVITGHVLQGSLSDNIFRYIIYSFHMPLFIGIAGYLISTDKLIQLSNWALVKKYCFRVVIPWSIAIVFYLLLLNYNSLPELSLKAFAGKIIRSFISPYYHLWFISSFIGWLFLTVVLLRFKIALKYILISSFFISTFFYLLDSHIISANFFGLKMLTKIVLHTFKPYFFFYFILGMYLRKFPVIFNIYINAALVVILGIMQLLLFYYPFLYLELISNIVFNLCLVQFLIVLASDNKLPNNKLLEWIGVNSLAIYLWHLVPIIDVKRVLGFDNMGLFYAVCFSLEIILITSIYYVSKIKIVNKYFFGVN